VSETSYFGRESIHNVKEEAIKLIQEMSDDCTYEDIQYHLYVKQKVLRSLKALEEGRYLSHEEVKQKLSKWLQ
jgi:predicted transcriptional regulator